MTEPKEQVAKRQRTYRDRMRDSGRIRCEYWLKPEEKLLVEQYLKSLKKSST